MVAAGTETVGDSGFVGRRTLRRGSAESALADEGEERSSSSSSISVAERRREEKVGLPRGKSETMHARRPRQVAGDGRTARTKALAHRASNDALGLSVAAVPRFAVQCGELLAEETISTK